MGVHLPDGLDDTNPVSFFKLFFDTNIVQMICDNSNEYAELQKGVKPVMYRYFQSLTETDFHKLLAILIHLE